MPNIKEQIDNLPKIQTILKENNILANKALGQNFLFDLNITDKIVKNSGSLKDYTIIEIGPGPGALTRSILRQDIKKLILIEKDDKFAKLQDQLLKPIAGEKLQIINDDALNEKIYDNIDGPIKIIANLPYNISTKLLCNWLDNIEKFQSFTLMFQKEVAMRICAEKSTKSYGRLSVKSQWFCDVREVFDIPASAFFPPPKITSTVVHLNKKTDPIKCDVKKLENIVKILFNNRRKTIRSSLKNILKNPDDILLKLNLEPNLRAENLSISDFCNLANII